ncbi:MAG: aminoacyltransferase, partial [Streptococcaceae bacterium]|nr:aminoacyltransferase [Streptococcaceae bacterium]
KELLHFFTQNLKKFGKKHHALFVKMDPAIQYRSFKVDEEQIINADAAMKIPSIKKTGAKWNGLTMEMDATIQPRFQANVHVKDFSEEQLSKKTRQMLRTARNKGVKTRITRMDGVLELTRLMSLTESRKNVRLRSNDEGIYYKKLLELYGEDAFILLAELNIKELLSQSEARLKQIEKDFSHLKENQEKKRRALVEQRFSVNRDVEELTEKLKTDGEVVNIAATLSIRFGETSEILYAGMDERYKRYMAPYLAWFDTIQALFEIGATSANMGGLEGSLKDGLLQFKKNFNPMIEEFIGEFDLPVNPILFNASQFAYKLKKSKKI